MQIEVKFATLQIFNTRAYQHLKTLELFAIACEFFSISKRLFKLYKPLIKNNKIYIIYVCFPFFTLQGIMLDNPL